MEIYPPLCNIASIVVVLAIKNDLLSLSENKVEQKTDNGKYDAQHNKDVIDNVDGHVERIEDNNWSTIQWDSICLCVEERCS